MPSSSEQDVRGRSTESSVKPMSAIAHWHAVDGGDDDVVELRGGVDAAQRAQPDLPACPVRCVPPGISTFSFWIASRTCSIDRPRAFSFSTSTTMWISRALPPFMRHVADAVHRFERALHLLVGHLGEGADRHRASTRARCVMIGVGVGIGLLDDGRQHFGRHVPHRARPPFRARCWRRRRGRARARSAR